MGRIGSDGTMKLAPVELLLEAAVLAETGAFESVLTGAPEALLGAAVSEAEGAAAGCALLPMKPPDTCHKVPELKKYTARATAIAPSRTEIHRPFMAKFSPQERAR
jgi:hypothetical protein